MIPEAIMTNLIDLTPLFAALFELQKYFVTRMLVWNMLVQLIVVGCIVLLARTFNCGCGFGTRKMESAM